MIQFDLRIFFEMGWNHQLGPLEHPYFFFGPLQFRKKKDTDTYPAVAPERNYRNGGFEFFWNQLYSASG